MNSSGYDAVIVGSGPNGLAAAITLAQAGWKTLVLEAHDTPGGGLRSAALTLPGFMHDVCSAVHPMGVGSPFFRTLPLEKYGLTWIDSPAPLAHVLADGSAITLERSLSETASQLGPDGPAYERLMKPFVTRHELLLRMALGPLRLPAAPLLFARFGLLAIRSLVGLARARFSGERAQALLAGIAAHASVPLDKLVTASFGLVLATTGHGLGWPVARGGSKAIADALIAHLRALGGELQVGTLVSDFAQLPPARAYLFDVAPQQLAKIAAKQLPARYRRRLERFRHGPGVYKVDWALRGPIPWSDARCARAVTVHLSGTLDDVAQAEQAVADGQLPERPFVLLGQPSIVDDSRAPPGMHTAWAYCHVPHGSSVDALAQIEAVVERAAPGFGAQILARSTRNAAEFQTYNPSCIGGDIHGGMSDLLQLFFRPVLRLDPYTTPARNIFLCSSSTPPGTGVHGMCGYWAAQSVLRRRF